MSDFHVVAASALLGVELRSEHVLLFLFHPLGDYCPSDSCYQQTSQPCFPLPFRASTACTSSVIFRVSRGHEFLCGCLSPPTIWSVHLLSLWFLAVVRSSSLGAALCSGTRKWGVGFRARSKTFLQFLLFSSSPVSEKSGGSTSSSQEFISSWGSVAFLCFNCFTSFCWKEKDFKLDGYSVYPSLGLPQWNKDVYFVVSVGWQ